MSKTIVLIKCCKFCGGGGRSKNDFIKLIINLEKISIVLDYDYVQVILSN